MVKSTELQFNNAIQVETNFPKSLILDRVHKVLKLSPA